MSYRALLFCPDEAAARLVTQVLSELEFTVELSFEPFVTVQKLSVEPFDAVVVDCANEENAALLFKGARNSTLNHSSLCVAVVEGQMGVAKAFRIGANLVLSKPINIEQSKGTLRVARGLLRDRKSTRLNSSHANISYAVFCLKKQNVRITVRKWSHRIEPAGARRLRRHRLDVAFLNTAPAFLALAESAKNSHNQLTLGRNQ